jgi:hypothetical protein
MKPSTERDPPSYTASLINGSNQSHSNSSKATPTGAHLGAEGRKSFLTE